MVESGGGKYIDNGTDIDNSIGIDIDKVSAARRKNQISHGRHRLPWHQHVGA